MNEVNAPKVKLDWSRLLGFDQEDLSDRPAKARDPRLAKIGNKPGTKVGVKSGTKLGVKLTNR